MAIEMEVVAVAAAAAVVVEETDDTARMSPTGRVVAPAADEGAARRRGGWLGRIMLPRESYLARGGRRWKLRAASATAKGGGGSGRAGSRLASTLSRSLRWKRLPGLPSLSLSLRSGSASAALDAVTFRVMYVVEAVVLGLALSCFFLCCGCHL